ncbi:unnamed protein product [Adineta steineri]|uniref:ABC transmembrane type-1 domain-containing protein n=1 Tax=Adineta steineri TaxID=433720 RepID=A0A816BSK5_9BILA|nr:unnamed protein product [Adineta steineri]CAF1613353.1 unnamed protein product [Adineta steineri]
MTSRHDDNKSENDVTKKESNNQNNKDTSSHVSVESDNISIVSALATGVSYAAMFYFNRQLLDNLILMGNNSMKMTNTDHYTVNSNECQSTYSSNTHNIISAYNAIQSISKSYIILGCISIFLYWVAWASWMTTAERQIRRIRYKLFRNILSQEIGWFDIHSIGELNTRLNDDLDKVKNGINEKVPDFVSLVSRAICVLIYGLIIGWKMSLVFLSVSPLIIFMYKITIVIIVKYSAKEIEAYSLASSIAEEALGNIRTVTSFHGQQKEEERFESLFNI